MASIRRTLSPSNHDRPFQTPLAPSSHRPINHPSPLATAASELRRLMMLICFQKPSRKWAHQHQLAWKRSFLRLLLCFLLGFLLGLSPFADLDDAELKPHHFFFDSVGPGGREIVRSEDSVAKRIDNDPDPDLVAVAAPPEKLLIIVTPTYNRALQAFYLSRLGQTLRLVAPPLLWIVVEMRSASMETAELLRRTGVMYRHLVCDKTSANLKDRGVHQRNTALEHIERHRLDGIVYFADDDNIYSLQLFERIREIRRFGTWPVAMLAQSKNRAALEGPVCNGSQVIGWHTNEKSKRLRRFHVDMSGFAFNSTILWDAKRWHRPTSNAVRQLDTVKEGFQETTFIEQVVGDESQMEGLPYDCSRIMNWHLHLESRHLVYPRGWQVSRNLDVVSSLR